MDTKITKTISVPKDKESEALLLIRLLENCLENGSKEELNKILEGVQPPPLSQEDTAIAKEIAGEDYVEENNILLSFTNLKKGFDLKQKLIADSFTTTQVQELIHCQTETTVHDRRKVGNLIALKHNGKYYFPSWQFDLEGDNALINNLPEILAALNEISDFAKLNWLTKPLEPFNNQIPWKILKSGDPQAIKDLIVEARGVCISH